MAKIHEEIVLIKISKLVKTDRNQSQIISQDLVDALQELSEQLVESGCVVEIEIPDQK